MKAKNFLGTVIVLLVVLINISFAQIATQGWNVYTSLQDVNSIDIVNNKVYVATTGGLYSFDYSSPQSNVKKYTNLDGLLNNDLLSVKADLNGNVWSGSNDGSINFFNPSQNTWRSITDIQLSTETSKGINGIFRYGRYIFFATDFSILKFDADRFEFIDAPYINLGPSMSPKTPVYKIYVVNDTIWAATKTGIAYANINDNLPNPSSWSDYTINNSQLKSNMINTVAYFNGTIYFGTDSGMYYHDQNTVSPYTPSYNGVPITSPVNCLSGSGNTLYFETYKTSNNIYKADLSNFNNAQLVYSSSYITTFKSGTNGDVLMGTQNRGTDFFANGNHTYVYPDGPYSNLILYCIADSRSWLWAVSGHLGDWPNLSGIYRFDGSKWKNYLAQNYPAMGTGCCGYWYIYPSRYNSDVWVTGWGNGLLRIIGGGDSLYRYTDANSIIAFAGNPGFDLCAGMDEDQNGKLWLLNSSVDKPIVNFSDSIAYPVPGGNSTNCFFNNMVIDNYNTKWMLLDPTYSNIHAIVYFNESANTGLVMGYSAFSPDVIAVNDICKDKDGQIWIATNNGIFIITDPYQVIQNPNSIPYMQKMAIIENGISTPLTENVTSVKTDGVNNKWIGTYSNGLLYVSPDGTTLLNRVTKSNSALIDNRINILAPDKGTGKIYIGTQSGLCSYQTVAVQALTDCDKIKAGPNPFLIPNDNLLRISGLVEGSNVKILTISGKLVIDFPSPGGKIATWDGRDKNGNLVASGIYIIIGYNQDGSKVCTGKVAVVRR